MREIRLAARPDGWPTDDTFEIADVPMPTAGPGQVLIRNAYMSVDPYMRGRMNDAKSYVPPFQLGAPLDGGAVGEVVASESPDVPVGAFVVHGLGWREYSVTEAARVRVVDPAAADLSAYLGVLGLTGFTAYVGLLDIAQFKTGETVFVSGAAGAVGSVVGQIAKLRGAKRVIGSAGSAEKVSHLVDDLGFDAAFNYRDSPVRKQLRQAAPDGIDVYFDNVGGDHLEAAIGSLNEGGRIVICGMISVYNNTEPAPGPRNLARLIQTRGRIEGFLVGDHYDLQSQFVQEVGPWVASGALKYRETIVEGIENNLEAFLGVLRGDNTGKMIVKL